MTMLHIGFFVLTFPTAWRVH